MTDLPNPFAPAAIAEETANFNAGLEAELAIYPGGVHAFDMFDLAIAHASRARQNRFVNACLEDWPSTELVIYPRM